MMKRITAIFLCLATLCSALLFVGCGAKKDDGAYITMYLTDEIYDFDPANAYYNNDTYNVVSLLFDTLFKLDKSGNVKKSLVKDYSFSDNDVKGEHKLVMTLNETYWSNGDRIAAEDVVFAWKRLLNWESSYESASLLFDVKNARAVKNGNKSIDELGVKASADYEVTVEFETAIDHEQFLLNLTSVALAPLRELDINEKGVQYDDWAKYPGFASSGPFKLVKATFLDCSELGSEYVYYDKHATPTSPNQVIAGDYAESRLQSFILERNSNYYRNQDQAIDKSVTAYRLVCDCTKTDEEIMQAYADGEIFYVGNIPYSVRSDSTYASLLKKAKVTDALSTFVLSMNQDATVLYSHLEKNSAGDVKLYSRSGSELRYTTRRVIRNDAGELMVELTLNSQVRTYDHVYDKNGNEISFDENGLDVGTKLFAIKEVRQALSLAINRQAVANAVVYAEAASGLVSSGVFENASSKTEFRKKSGNLIAASANLDAAKEKLREASVDPSQYSITITVNANDDVHVAIVNMIQEFWGTDGLGFHVNVYQLGAVVNTDYYATTSSRPTDFADNLFTETIQYGEYDVIGYDYMAYSADAFSQLAPFATDFSGNGILSTPVDNGSTVTSYEYSVLGHKNGYANEEYDLLIEAAWYLQYYNSITADNYESFGYADPTKNRVEREQLGKQEFGELLNKINEIYTKYNINTEKNLKAGRATLLHEAEKLLIEDMPVIPVIFNQNAVLVSNKLTGVDSTFYAPAAFRKTNLKNYQKYLDEFESLYK